MPHVIPIYAVEADPLPTTTVSVQNTSTVTAQVTGTSARGQASVVPLTVAIIIAAVLGSILGLILVGGAVALITYLVLCRRKSPPLHKNVDVIAAIQGMVMSASTETLLSNIYKWKLIILNIGYP